jgi:hypothetical protein
VLFTLSHGINTTGDVEKIRRERGKLRFDSNEYLTAEMAAHESVLPGGVWFMFACFGAATPARSLYWQWLDRAFAGCSRFAIDLAKRNALETLADASLTPFVSALPKALLANPKGPLAVVGHADYAWPASYDLLVGTGADPWERFMRIPSLLAAPYYHKRVGSAFSIFRSLHTIDEVLNGWYKDIDEAQQRGTTANVDSHELGKLWMHRQDLAQYILLGDPAIRLPLKNC